MSAFRKVVVTGGAGFIGANLCRHLIRAGVDEVVALDDLSTGVEENLRRVPAELLVGSILDRSALDHAVAGASAVVHLAARPSVPRSIADPVASHEVNTTGTMEVLEAVRRHDVPYVVVASSSSVYGANSTLPKHERLAAQPMSPYAATKLAAEAYTLAWSHVWDIKALAFRFFNVFGPLQPAGHAYAAVIPAFVNAAHKGEPLSVHGDGKQTRDFTFVESVTAVITQAVIHSIAHAEPVNLAFGGRYTLLEVINRLERILDHPVERIHTDPRPGDVRDSQADQTRLRSLFPDIEPVDLDTGLRHTIEWFKGKQP